MNIEIDEETKHGLQIIFNETIYSDEVYACGLIPWQELCEVFKAKEFIAKFAGVDYKKPTTDELLWSKRFQPNGALGGYGNPEMDCAPDWYKRGLDGPDV